MAIQYKRLLIWHILLCCGTGLIQAQTAQPSFELGIKMTGSTKAYIARDYIRLINGFSYKATPGNTFSAKIDPNLVFNYNPAPGDVSVTPGDTVYTPGGTFGSDPVKNIGGLMAFTSTTTRSATGENTFTDVAIRDTSYVIPVLWFKTVPTSSNLNGYYRWKDVSPSQAVLRKYDSRGAAYGDEYTVTRDKVRTFNFNPAMDLGYESVSKEILVPGTNLTHATIIGVWGTKENDWTAYKFMFAVNGRKNAGILFSKSSVIPGDTTQTALAYGTRNFLYQANGIEVSETKFHERALRIGTYYKVNTPDNTVWGEPQKAVLTLGGNFQTSDVNNTTAFKSQWNNFEGFKGFTPELLVFDRVLSPTENSIFESYLALKYGLTLNKSYLSANGNVIWDYKTDSIYSNRITGYGREDRLGFNQKMATTSYEETPNFSELLANDSYDLNDSYNLSSRNRLLVVGRQPANPMTNGEYAVMGDNDGALSLAATSINGVDSVMIRKWLVNTNMQQTLPRVLGWNTSGATYAETDFIGRITKTQSSGSLVTSTPLSSNDGYLAWMVGVQQGPVTVKFGANSSTITTDDYGFKISATGDVYTIKQGIQSSNRVYSVSSGQRVEVEKSSSILYLRVNGVRYKNTEMIINPADQAKSYFGAILLDENTNDSTMIALRHGGFVDTGNRIELSYLNPKTARFNPYKKGIAYLLVDRTGTGSFSTNTERYPVTDVDETRSKIIFNNVFWDPVNNGKKAVFTFGVQKTTSSLRSAMAPDQNDEDEASNHLSVYYKDIKDLTTVTVNVQFVKPSPSTIYLFDLSGSCLSRTELAASKEAQITDIRLPGSGVYVVKIRSNDKEITRKVVSVYK